MVGFLENGLSSSFDMSNNNRVRDKKTQKITKFLDTKTEVIPIVVGAIGPELYWEYIITWVVASCKILYWNRLVS